MSKNYLFAGALLLGCMVLPQQLVAGPLTSAEVTKIINRVAVIDPAAGEHPAIVREVIKDDLGLQTGEKSRSELLFQDNTLTRLGAETFFSFKTGTRDMTLEKGSMLLQVPKGLGGAKIHTAAVTAAITGTTIMMEYIPGKYIKVLVLEGSLRLSRNGTFGDSLVLRPGKMVIMRPDAKKIPEPVDVDLKRIVKTSTLVNFPDSAPLPSMDLIQGAIDVQSTSLAKGDLAPTNLVMGHGTDVILASNDQLAKIVALNPADPSGNGSLPNVPDNDPAGTVLASAPPLPITVPSVDPLPATLPVTATLDPLSLAATVPIATAPLAAVESLTGTATSLPLVTSVTSTVAALPIIGSLAGTTASPPLLDAVTSIASLPIVTQLTGTAPLPLVDSVTSTVAALPILNSVIGSAASLPVIGSANGITPTVINSISSITASAPTVTSITSIVSTAPANINALTGSTGTGSLPVSNLLSPTQTTTPTVSVSSSAQLLTMLSNTSLGTATHTATAPASAPLATNNSSTPPVASTLPLLPTVTLTTLTSAPATVTSGTISSQGKKPTTLPLGLRR